MPVILEPGSDAMRTWLDPHRTTWSRELQSILEPYKGQLECYPVPKEVGKVGNNSPDFLVPINSRQNRKNIANFFATASKKGEKKGGIGKPLVEKSESRGIYAEGEQRETKDHAWSEDNAPLPVPKGEEIDEKATLPRGIKREYTLDEKDNIEAEAETSKLVGPPQKKSRPAKSATETRVRKLHSTTGHDTSLEAGNRRA
jgi:hypothetical protein